MNIQWVRAARPMSMCSSRMPSASYEYVLWLTLKDLISVSDTSVLWPTLLFSIHVCCDRLCLFLIHMFCDPLSKPNFCFQYTCAVTDFICLRYVCAATHSQTYSLFWNVCAVSYFAFYDAHMLWPTRFVYDAYVLWPTLFVYDTYVLQPNLKRTLCFETYVLCPTLSFFDTHVLWPTRFVYDTYMLWPTLPVSDTYVLHPTLKPTLFQNVCAVSYIICFRYTCAVTYSIYFPTCCDLPCPFTIQMSCDLLSKIISHLRLQFACIFTLIWAFFHNFASVLTAWRACWGLL